MRCSRRPSPPLLAFFFAVGGVAFAACGTEATVLGLNQAKGADGGSGPDASAAPIVDSGGDDSGGDSASESGADQCAPCAVGQRCTTVSDCLPTPGVACVNGTCALSTTCAELKLRSPAATDGVYTVDVDGPATGSAPFAVYCDMTTAGGGWTRVAFEPARSGGDHIQGNLAYLGIEVGAPEAVANASGSGLVGMRFNGHYSELAITWGNDYAQMTVSKDIFVNQVDVAIAVGNFVTGNATLAGWVTAAGGAILCRASRSPDVRPGDTSWAVKPRDSTGTGCGCDDPTWRDRGAFYGGVLLSTSCTPWGGGWAGVRADGQNKAGLASTTDLALWIR